MHWMFIAGSPLSGLMPDIGWHNGVIGCIFKYRIHTAIWNLFTIPSHLPFSGITSWELSSSVHIKVIPCPPTFSIWCTWNPTIIIRIDLSKTICWGMLKYICDCCINCLKSDKMITHSSPLLTNLLDLWGSYPTWYSSRIPTGYGPSLATIPSSIPWQHSCLPPHSLILYPSSLNLLSYQLDLPCLLKFPYSRELPTTLIRL